MLDAALGPSFDALENLPGQIRGLVREQDEALTSRVSGEMAEKLEGLSAAGLFAARAVDEYAEAWRELQDVLERCAE
jgi:hypothetical protein